MQVLLDTHTFLWWIDNDRRLSSQARTIIGDGSNALFFSAARGWEIAIKARLGKLQVPGDLAPFITDHLVCNNVTTLSIHLSHTLYVYTLPSLHRDPFDRLLVAQSQLEHLPILTADPLIQQYAVETIW
jgi:PIN domain nuclease of toxin-antitoxin system